MQPTLKSNVLTRSGGAQKKNHREDFLFSILFQSEGKDLYFLVQSYSKAIFRGLGSIIKC